MKLLIDEFRAIDFGQVVGAQLIGASPIHRPGKSIDKPLADESAVGAINRPLQLVRCHP